jgi:hypothetical protein
MPDDDFTIQDFTIHDAEHVLEGATGPDEVSVPEGDSGILATQPTDPNFLKIILDGNSITIAFNGVEVPDEVCISGYRMQMAKFLDQHPECTVLTFDVTGLKLVPSGMLGLLTSMHKRVRQIEILNPSNDIREVLRVSKLNTLFKIRQS